MKRLIDPLIFFNKAKDDALLLKYLYFRKIDEPFKFKIFDLTLNITLHGWAHFMTKSPKLQIVKTRKLLA